MEHDDARRMLPQRACCHTACAHLGETCKVKTRGQAPLTVDPGCGMKAAVGSMAGELWGKPQEIPCMLRGEGAPLLSGEEEILP